MKAPKLFLALGLSVPILVQGLSHSQHGGSHLAEPAAESDHHQRDQSLELEPDSSDHQVEEGDAEPDHGLTFTSQKIPLSAISSEPTPVEQRDTADHDRDPPKTRCNPMAPFCSKHPSEADSSDMSGGAHGKREFDTPDYFETHPSEPAQKPESSYVWIDPDAEFDRESKRMKDWYEIMLESKSSSMSDKDDERGIEPDELMTNAFKCSLLDRNCERLAGFNCACDLRQRCGLRHYDDVTALTFTELNKCIHPDTHQSRRDVHDDDDNKSIRCATAYDACSRGLDCACRLSNQCDDPNVSGPGWSDVGHCIAFQHNDDDDDLVKREFEDDEDKSVRCTWVHEACADGLDCACRLSDQCDDPHVPGPSLSDVSHCVLFHHNDDDDDSLVKRDGGDAESSSKEACKTAFDQCRRDYKSCACDWSTQCRLFSPLDNWKVKMMKKCLNAGHVPRDHGLVERDVEDAEDDAKKTCSTAFDQCRRGSSWCACHWSRRCHSRDHLSDRNVEMMKECLNIRYVPRDALPPFSLTGTAGVATTWIVQGATHAMSIAQTAPYVGVETVGAQGSGATQVVSLVSTDPYVLDATGTSAGEPFGTTQTLAILAISHVTDEDDAVLERRATQTPAAQHDSARADEAITLTVDGATAGLSIADATPNVLFATHAEGTEAGTLVMSAIETDPPAVAVSGSWDDAVLPTTTLDLEFVQNWLSMPDLIDEYLEDEDALNQAHNAQPSLTPGAVITSQYHVSGAPASAVYSVAETSPLVIVEKYYDGNHARTHTQAFPAWVTPPVTKRDSGERDAQYAAPSTSTTTFVVAGNSSTPYFQATDAQGRPIYVTQTGNYAASTETVTFSASVPPASTTRKGEVVQISVVTTTQTIYAGGAHTLYLEPACTRRKMSMQPDATVLNIGPGQTNISYTNAMQNVNGTVMRYAHPQATLMPLFPNGMGGGHGRYPPVTTLNKDNVYQYFKVPVIFESEGSNTNTTYTDRMASSTQTMDGGQVVVMDPLAKYQMYDARHHRVAPTPACVGNKGVFGLFNGWGKKGCMIERCMWKHMRPLEIHTVFPAKMNDNECHEVSAYFTQKTRLEEPHWGTTHGDRTYYPALLHRVTSTTTKTGTDRTADVHIYPTCALKRQYPPGYNSKNKLNTGVVGDPHCTDMKSCHRHCQHHHGPSIPQPLLLALVISLPLLVGLPIFALLFCCLPMWWLHRRRRERYQQDPNAVNTEKERRPSVMDKLRRKSTGHPDSVVNSVTGQAIDPATGRAVEGGPGAATAIVAGSAAGAAAAGAGGGGAGHGEGDGGAGGHGSGSGAGGGASGDHGGGASPAGAAGAAGDPTTKVVGGGDDGKGTLGRQAEEGRSRVHFDEAPKTAGEAPKAVSEGEPHAEAVPPKTDGTIESASGREWVDVGSMRGRKRARGDGAQGVNLGF